MICMWIWDNAVLGMEGIGSDLAAPPPTTARVSLSYVWRDGRRNASARQVRFG
jgi:hypothetical protein